MGRDYKWGHHRQSRPISKLLVYTVNVAFPHISSKLKRKHPGMWGQNHLQLYAASVCTAVEPNTGTISIRNWVECFFKEVDSLVHSRWRRKVEENVADG